jgi:hypothetical protein
MKFKLFKKKDKTSKRDKMILEEYEKGRILQVDGKTDNKTYFKSLEEKDGYKEIIE